MRQAYGAPVEPRRGTSRRGWVALALALVAAAAWTEPARGDDRPLPPPVVRPARGAAPARPPAPAAPVPQAPALPPPATPTPPAPRPSAAPLPRDPVTLPAARTRVLRPGTPFPAPRPLPAAVPGASAPDSGTPPAVPEGLVSVPPRPQRPSHLREAGPEDLVFEVERPGGVIKRFPEEGGSAAYVMQGNPRLTGQAHRRRDGQEVDALRIQATTVVAWVDERALPEIKSLAGGSETGAAGAARPPGADKPWMALFEEAVLGIYAEGAVEVVYGELVFRAESLYLEPSTYRGLLLSPSFEGRIAGRGLDARGVPAFTKARRARLVAKGRMVFDDAEVSTNRADDRIVLRVRQLEVEEQAEEEKRLGASASPAFLGFRSVTTQRYRGRQIEVWAERLPLAQVPYASFGLATRDPFPMTIEHLEAGNRSGLGLFAFVGIGGDVGPEEDPWGHWVLDVGGYTKRGPGGGLAFEWARPRSVGKIATWGVIFDEGEDRNDYDPEDDHVRGRLVAESRTYLADDLLFDVEFNTFTDRGFNTEYFERDELTHKDRESYGRLLWRRPSFAATLTGKWHEREFVTETVEAPEAGLWLGSVPLVTPGARGGLGVDLVSTNRAGWLGRRFDEDLALEGYDALRVDSDTRLAAGATVGDVRLSAWSGIAATSYQERDDGGEDLTRTALLAGVRANVQLHRLYAAHGGPFALDGLRHVIDLDGVIQGRFFDSAGPDEVPTFDQVEEVEERGELSLRARQRLQTRGQGAAPPRDVLDLETGFHWYVDDVAPYLQREPWALDWSMRGDLRPDARLRVASEGLVLGDLGLQSLTAGVGVAPSDRVSVALAYRYLKDEAAAPLLQAAWRWSEKYEVSMTESYNFRNEDNFFRVVLRRFSQDHTWSFGVSLRGVDDVGFVLDFRPTIGGATGTEPPAFENEVDLDPTGAFR